MEATNIGALRKRIVVNKELLDCIVNSLNSVNQGLQKVTFIGPDFVMKKHINKLNACFKIKRLDNFEKAKKWLVP